MSSLRGRVRQPTDRNLAAAARRQAVVPGNMLLRQYLHRVPDFVETLGTAADGKPLYRAFFKDGERYVCLIRLPQFRAGVRMPSISQVLVLTEPEEAVIGQPQPPRVFVVDSMRIAPNYRIASVHLTRVEG